MGVCGWVGRSNGWIHTLLEEAENERMHLLTFLSIKDKPHWLFRACVIGGQARQAALRESVPRIALPSTIVVSVKQC